MDRLIRLAPWVSRVVLAGATFVFAMIGLRYIADPVHAVEATGAAFAVAAVRVGGGAFPLGCAIFTFACLLSVRRLLTGVSLVATVVGTAIVVRIFAVFTDGAAAARTRLFIPEAVIVVLALAGIVLESLRRKKETEAPA